MSDSCLTNFSSNNDNKMKSPHINCLIVGLLGAFALSCSNKDNSNNSTYLGSTKTLDFTSPKSLSTSSIIKNQQHILLENTEESLFTQVDKAIFKDDKIYILDITGQYHLFIFDKDGKFLKKVGNRGNGPGEYRMLCDFDIADDGTIYLYDRQKKRMFIHNKSGELIEILDMPFRADAFIKLSNGYLFSMAINNENKDIGNTKVVATDNSFKILKKYFNYQKDFKDDKGDCGLFVRSKSGILYNKPVSDSVYVFDENTGGIKNCFLINFGKKAVPVSLAANFGDVLNSVVKNELCFMDRMPYLLGDYLIGNVTDSNKQGVIFHNFKKGNSFIDYIDKKEYSHKNLNYPVGIMGDSVIVTPMDAQNYAADIDKKELDKRSLDHIQNGGYLLFLNKI